MKNEVMRISQASVAQALAADYFCIYYVNTENDKFIEYSAAPEYKEFGLPPAGDDIITFARTNFEEIIYPEDRAHFLETFTKETILEALDTYGHFTMIFRLMFKGIPTYVHLKITRMIEEESRHVVIGISSVDEQMKAQEAFRKARYASITYSKVAQALAGDYFSIYVVDTDTDHFIEYSSADQYESLGIEKEGDDFFNTSRRNMRRVIDEGDRERFLSVFTKEKLLSNLARDGSFTMKYRLIIGGEPVWVSMKATLLEDSDGRHLIIGTNNIDAQMKREQEYQKRMEEARTSARNDFLANMSHDIRTPMNAIVGYTNIAKSRKDDPAMVAEALEKIGSSSHFLLSLINDILDFSKIESGKMQLSVGICDLGTVFRRIEDITLLQASSKDLKISYDHNSVRHFKVYADELRIEQILVNIISNAIKYTPSGGSVDLIAEEESANDNSGRHKYRFIVRDTGIGISEEYLPHIFESFTREEKTTVNRVQGTGLGLAITARIVELMDGRISVKSKPGMGSEFTVELELESAEREAPDGKNDSPTGFVAGDDPAAVREAYRMADSSAGTAAGSSADFPDGTAAGAGPGTGSGNEAGSAELSGRRVLLVEDNDINAEIVCITLEQYGLEVDHAENGQIGYDKIRSLGSGSYDAVLMDIQMPVMDGYEATRKIRTLEGDYFRELPIIAMSANAYDEDVRRCLEAGMNAHLAKPFQPEVLIELLSQYLN
ncbi:MAG: response regulator [Lachnospiraceae bacterium]|nr:response regulator [Lachnospiraceae bacterium]